MIAGRTPREFAKEAIDIGVWTFGLVAIVGTGVAFGVGALVGNVVLTLILGVSGVFAVDSVDRLAGRFNRGEA